MRNSCAVFLLATLASTAGLAQDLAGPLFDETSYVFRTHQPRALDNVAVDCAWATPLLMGGVVEGGASVSLFSLDTDPNTGKVANDRIIRIGGLLACWGTAEPEIEAPGNFTFDTGVVYSFDILGTHYIALGTSRLRTPPGFLEGTSDTSYGMSLSGIDATVWTRVNDGPGTPVGTFTANELANPTGVPDYKDGAIITVRLFRALDPGNRALLDILKKSGVIN